VMRAFSGGVAIPAKPGSEPIDARVQRRDEAHVQRTGPSGEDILAAVAHDDQRMVLGGFDDDALSGLCDGIHVQHVRRVDSNRHLWRRDEQRRGDACEPAGRVLVESLDRGDPQFEPLRNAADNVLVEDGPAQALAQLRGKIATSSSELAADGYEIDFLVLHCWFGTIGSGRPAWVLVPSALDPAAVWFTFNVY
jgi:hypothetical protein